MPISVTPTSEVHASAMLLVLPVASDVKLFIPSFIKVCRWIQYFKAGTHKMTHRQHGELMRQFSFLREQMQLLQHYLFNIVPQDICTLYTSRPFVSASRTILSSQLVNSLGSSWEVTFSFWLYTSAVLVFVVHLCGSEVLLSSDADFSRNNPSPNVFSSTHKHQTQWVMKKQLFIARLLSPVM